MVFESVQEKHLDKTTSSEFCWGKKANLTNPFMAYEI